VSAVAAIAGESVHQRALGRGAISASTRDGVTRVATLREDGAAKIRLPNTHDASLQAVLINTAGGLCGGDDLHWEATAGPGAHLVLTTQACERVYRSLGDDADVAIRLTAQAGARIDWLPQETILFEGSRLMRRLEVDLAPGATFLAVEAVLLGRQARGEDARNAVLTDDWRVRRGGALIHAEATRLSDPDIERNASSLLAGAGAFVTILYVADDAERRLDAVRALLPDTAGASVTGERLVVRALAPSGMALRRIVVPVITLLSATGSLPRLWHS
jgi:urease accessory protein